MGAASSTESSESNYRARADTSLVLPADNVHSSVQAIYTSQGTPSNSISTSSSATVSPASSSSHQMLSSIEVEAKFNSTYEFLQFLGRGSSAEVYLIRHRGTAESYACKIVKKGTAINDQRTMATEVAIMKKIQNENLLTMYELYETSDTIWMVLELAQGDLVHSLANLRNYNEVSISKLFRQILVAVKYLHGKGIVHRDLKLDNLLYTSLLVDENAQASENPLSMEDVQVKIADFGLSALTNIKREPDAKKSLKYKQIRNLKEMWGTVEYFAPEVYNRAYGFQADIWALGCILYELLTGEIAFPYREVKPPMFERLINGLEKPKRSFEIKAGWKELSPEVQSLIKGMLKLNPAKRFDIDECLQHPWISGVSHTSRHKMELASTKKMMRDRSQRRLRRHEALLKDIEVEKRRNQALAKLNIG